MPPNGAVKSIACLTNMGVVHPSTRETGVLRSLSDGLSEVFNSNEIGVHMVQADVDGMPLCDLLRNLDPSVAITVEEESAKPLGPSVRRRGPVVQTV
jgi:hypothetical protein